MDCLFCKIVEGEIPSYKIYEDEFVIAFLDINPVSNGHTLIVPKKHYTDFLELDSDTFNHVINVAKKIHKSLEEKLNCDGITYLHNYGIAQDVKHYHLHLIPKYKNEVKVDVKEIFAKLK